PVGLERVLREGHDRVGQVSPPVLGHHHAARACDRDDDGEDRSHRAPPRTKPAWPAPTRGAIVKPRGHAPARFLRARARSPAITTSTMPSAEPKMSALKSSANVVRESTVPWNS